MLKQKQMGFTLIELLVVIVIIGILATISTATFRGYFGQARDSVRQSGVENVALMIKVERAAYEANEYSNATSNGAAATGIMSLAQVQAILTANDYEIPADAAYGGIYLGVRDTNYDEFFVTTCNDDDDDIYVAGSTNGSADGASTGANNGRALATACVEGTDLAVTAGADVTINGTQYDVIQLN